MEQAAISASLDALGAGDIDIGDARAAVSEAYDQGETMGAEIHDALRDSAWRMIRAGSPPENFAEWHDLHLHAAALAHEAGSDALAHRLEAFADMVGRHARFLEAQPVDEVLSRRRVPALLRELAASGGRLARADVRKRLEMKEANLSRLIGILLGHGLIERRRDGNSVEIRLTEAGKSVAAKIKRRNRRREKLTAPAVERRRAMA